MPEPEAKEALHTHQSTGRTELFKTNTGRTVLFLNIHTLALDTTYRAPSTLRILYVKNNACLLGVKLIGGALGEILNSS